MTGRCLKPPGFLEARLKLSVLYYIQPYHHRGVPTIMVVVEVQVRCRFNQHLFDGYLAGDGDYAMERLPPTFRVRSSTTSASLKLSTILNGLGKEMPGDGPISRRPHAQT